MHHRLPQPPAAASNANRKRAKALAALGELEKDK